MKAVEELLAELGGKDSEVLRLIKELTGLVAYYRRMLEYNEMDDLTGMKGANAFRNFIKGIEDRTRSVGIIFFDVNGLKECNDTLGHKAGDMLLQKAAESISAIKHPNTAAFRIGGDEFAVVISDCEEAAIDECLIAWREKLAELNAADDGLPCSIAAGAAYARGVFRFSDVLALADQRMYTQKEKMKTA